MVGETREGGKERRRGEAREVVKESLAGKARGWEAVERRRDKEKSREKAGTEEHAYTNTRV